MENELDSLACAACPTRRLTRQILHAIYTLLEVQSELIEGPEWMDWRLNSQRLREVRATCSEIEVNVLRLDSSNDYA